MLYNETIYIPHGSEVVDELTRKCDYLHRYSSTYVQSHLYVHVHLWHASPALVCHAFGEKWTSLVFPLH